MYAKPKFRKSRFRDPMYFWVILGDYKLWGPDYMMIKLAIFKVLVFLANLMHEFPLFFLDKHKNRCYNTFYSTLEPL